MRSLDLIKTSCHLAGPIGNNNSHTHTVSMSLNSPKPKNKTPLLLQKSNSENVEVGVRGRQSNGLAVLCTLANQVNRLPRCCLGRRHRNFTNWPMSHLLSTPLPTNEIPGAAAIDSIPVHYSALRLASPPPPPHMCALVVIGLGLSAPSRRSS